MDKKLAYRSLCCIIRTRKDLMVWIGIQEAFYRSRKEKCAYDDQGDAGEKEGARSYLCLTYAQIAERSGLPVGTVQKVLGGITLTPRYDTIMALESVLGEEQPVAVRESARPYNVKKQGEYTLEDYYQYPDDIRVELIDGVIYYMSSPTSAHQLIGGYIYSKMLQHMLNNGGECLPMIAPMDVQLDCDDRTMVEPDVLIVCDRDKIINRCVYGAPDFIIEILSKSTKKKDSVIKLNKYLNAGVREYWMIDPMKKKVIVYDFAHDEYPIIYGFDAKVPVGIWNGNLEIDFAEVYDHVRFLYEREK